MKNEKLVILFIVSILLLVTFSPVASARFKIINKNSEEKETGTVNYFEDKDQYLIKGDNGILFLGKKFFRYLPINLPNEFQQEDLELKFNSKINLKKIFTLDGLWYLIRGILPITITNIENVVNLNLDISPNKQQYEIGESIKVKASITNLGKSQIRLRNMFNGVTLKIKLLTPDGKKLQYFGDLPDCPPGLRILNPGKTYSIDIKINDGQFGYKENQNIIFYNFTKPGEYKINGNYISFGASPCDEIQYNDIWEGKLTSLQNNFKVESNNSGIIEGSVREQPEMPIPLIIPVENATVRAYKMPIFASESTDLPEEYYETFTDSNGIYQLTVESGFHYSIIVTKNGYSTDSMVIKISDPGEVVKHINFILEKVIHFDISLHKQKFHVGESIPITAKIFNKDDKTIRVSQISLEAASLNFRILTPDGKTVSYQGPHVDCYPYSLLLEQDEIHSIKLDLKNDFYEFGFVEDHNVVRYKFETPGEYKIIGSYHSFKKSCDEMQYDDILVCSLISQEYTFEVFEDQPNMIN